MVLQNFPLKFLSRHSRIWYGPILRRAHLDQLRKWIFDAFLKLYSKWCFNIWKNYNVIHIFWSSLPRHVPWNHLCNHLHGSSLGIIPCEQHNPEVFVLPICLHHKIDRRILQMRHEIAVAVIHCLLSARVCFRHPLSDHSHRAWCENGLRERWRWLTKSEDVVLCNREVHRIHDIFNQDMERHAGVNGDTWVSQACEKKDRIGGDNSNQAYIWHSSMSTHPLTLTLCHLSLCWLMLSLDCLIALLSFPNELLNLYTLSRPLSFRLF